MIMTEYLPILVFLILAFGISMGAIFSSLVVGERNAHPDKNSTYECGFDPFDDSRGKFDVRFYLVSILFIIFDLEVSFLFPWALTFFNSNLMLLPSIHRQILWLKPKGKTSLKCNQIIPTL